jgi:catechol 2,3-dioxygenase-like lactoylglutathione lyase family enzyme
VKVASIDHVVLTVRDLSRTIEFYRRVLGMRHVVFEGRFNALHFGSQKINLHPFRAEYLPHADIPAPGTGDLCLVCDGQIEEVVRDLATHGVEIEVGPVEQTGAGGAMDSVYIRDPDKNLIEIACYRE